MCLSGLMSLQKGVRVSDDDAGEFSVLEGSLGGAIVEQVPRTGKEVP